MKLNEFIEFVAMPTWELDTEVNVEEHETHYIDGEDNSGNQIQISVAHTWGIGLRYAKKGAVTITYAETFSYDDDDFEGSFDASTSGQEVVWTVEGVLVVDEVGGVISDNTLGDYMPDEFSNVEYEGEE